MKFIDFKNHKVIDIDNKSSYKVQKVLLNTKELINYTPKELEEVIASQIDTDSYNDLAVLIRVIMSGEFEDGDLEGLFLSSIFSKVIKKTVTAIPSDRQYAATPVYLLDANPMAPQLDLNKIGCYVNSFKYLNITIETKKGTVLECLI